MAPSPESRSATNRAGYSLMFLALVVPYSYFNHSAGWNQMARLAELHAIVLQGTVRIDAYHEITGDKAVIDGHYYSEKAPVIVAAALPPFALTVMAQRIAGVDPDAPSGWRVSEWITTAACVGVLAALGGVAFFALTASRLGTEVALLSTFGVFLGTLTFPYATTLFAHAGTIGLVAVALWAVLDTVSPSRARDFIGGLAAGFAVASEYPAALACAVLALYLASVSWQRLWRFGLATLPAVGLILVNNYLISGSPFQLSYGSNPLFPEMTTGNWMGFWLPDLRLTPSLLWSEYRGLMFWSPILLLAVPGIVQLYRADRSIAMMIIAACVLTFLEVAAFYNWSGGNSFGPRYLSPAVPFIGLAAGYGIRRFPEMGLVLSVISIGLMLMVTSIAIDPPGDVLTPLQSFYWVRIQQDRFADNLGTLLGAPVWVSLIAPMLVPAVVARKLLKEPVSG